MNRLKKKIDESAKFYTSSILDFDIKLADYNFKTFCPFFRGRNALEIGPASGYMTKKLVPEFQELHLLEGSLELLNQVPEYPNVKKYNAIIEEFDTTNKYDTIIMSHVLEHIEKPILALKRIYNWLNNDGVFLVSVPNAKSIHRMVAVEMGLLESEYQLNQRDNELGHYRIYDLQLLQEDLISAGFKIIDTGGIFYKPLSNAQIENNWTNEMIEGFYELGKKFKENCAEIFVVASK